MNIQLKRVNDAVRFEASNEAGNTVTIEGSPALGGENQGARPMELLLMGLGGCSAMDIVSILKKQRQDLQDLNIDVSAERADGEPAVFEKIHVHFRFTGNLDESKVKRAVELSMDTYCSVSRMLEKTAEISYEFSITRSAT